MKKKSWIVYLMIFSLVAAMLTGCDKSPEEVDMTIDSEMTGFEDFMMRTFEGDQYLIVYGSQGSEVDTTRLKNYAEYLDSILNFQEEGQLMIQSDADVTEVDIQEKHIILLGNPETNSLFAQVNEQLPIQVIDSRVEIPDVGWTIGEETATFTYLIPNPLNLNNYLWVIGATNSDHFSSLRFMTMNLKRDEYLIKADERTRYSGTFSKSSMGWTISHLEARETIGEFEFAGSEHFVIHYSPVDQQTKEKMVDILQKREVVYQKITDRLGFEPDNRIDIDIYMTEAIMEHYVDRDDDFLSGLSYEVHKQGREDPRYRENIARVFLGTCGVPLDRMTLDGMTYALSAEKTANPAVKESVVAEDYIPLRYLIGPRIDPKMDSAIAELELQSFFEYLIKAYGMDKAIALVQANESTDIEEALLTVYGKDLFNLEGEWIEELTQ